MKKPIVGFCIVAGGLSAMLLAGCGGGTGNLSPTTTGYQTVCPVPVVADGRATVSLRWPDSPPSSSSRLVPLDASSVRVSFLDANGAVLQTALLVRPAPGTGLVSTAFFQDLLPGVLTVQATAFPNADGTGTAQASVTGQTTIIQNQLVTVNLTMGTTITRVEILPVIVQITGNGSTTLTAVAYDANDNLVLSNQWAWAIADPNILSLAPHGATADITPVGVGTTVVTLTETETGIFSTKTLVVTSMPVGP